MARRAALLSLALVVLIAAAAPSLASARVAVSSTDLGRGAGKQLLINADGENDVVVLSQNDGSSAGIAVTSTRPIDVGSGCVIVPSTGVFRAQCDTDGVASISVQLSAQATAAPDTNRLNAIGVAQAGPDGVPLPVRVNGGPGRDTIEEGPGALTVTAGAGDDFIDAGPGDDRLDEGLGDDVVLAGPGNDRLASFPTRDSDILSGGPGTDSVISRGTVTLNDLLCNDGGTGDGPAALGVPRDVQAPEGRLQCAGTAADRDLLAGIEAVSPAFGNEPVDFTGSGADEVLQGQQGSDRLEGGGGRDSLLGFEGNDLLLGRDQAADARIDCGEGGGDDDRAVVDEADPVEPNCETIERGRAELPGPVGGGDPAPVFEGFPPPPPPSPPQGNQPSSGNEGNGAGGGDNGRTPPELEIPTAVAFVRRNRIQIRVRCVYRAQNCVGRLTLTAAQNRRVGKRRVRKGQRLARGNVRVPWGTSKATSLRSPSSLSALLRALRGRTLKVRALVEARDGAAPRTARPARVSRVVTLGLQR